MQTYRGDEYWHYYGFLANRCRERKLARIRAALATILPLRCAAVVPFR